jgi:hypothetical protein
MLQNAKKAAAYLFAAYWVVTILGFLLTVLFWILLDPPTPEELGVTASQAPAYLMTIPYHPLLNLLVWPWFAWLYLRGLPAAQRSREGLLLGAAWTVATIVVDLVGWVFIRHPWAMTFKEFYVDYQPWITMVYGIIFLSPVAAAWLLNRAASEQKMEQLSA